MLIYNTMEIPFYDASLENIETLLLKYSLYLYKVTWIGPLTTLLTHYQTKNFLTGPN